MGHPFDGRPIKRVQIGTDRPPAPDPIEAQARRLAERAETESRLKAAEPLWRTVQQAAGGGAVSAATEEPYIVNPETGAIWTGHPDDFNY